MIEKIENHHLEAVERSFTAFQRKENYLKVLEIFTERTQILENIIFALMSAKLIENATGDILNKIGKMVGRIRPIYGPAATDDDKYRSLIYAKIAENICQGTHEELIEILKLFGAEKVYLNNVYSAGLTVNINGTILLSLDEIRTILSLITASIEIDLTNYTNKPFGFNDLQTFGFGVGELGSSKYNE